MTFPNDAPESTAARKNTKRNAAIGVGGLFALLVSCGTGAAMSGSDTPKVAAPSTVTSVQTETTTVVKTTTVSAKPSAAPVVTSATTTTTERVAPAADDTTTTQRPRQLVPQTTNEAPAAPAPDSTYYANCAAARAAGAAPLYRGSPGYRSGLDGDGDGVACEKR